jgi:hypothetical protein
MADNPNVVMPQVQQAVHVPLPADDPALFGASLLVIGFNVDTIIWNEHCKELLLLPVIAI